MVSSITYPSHPKPDSPTARTLDRQRGACGPVSYALVALVLRLVMARVFFLSGQAKIAGPGLPITIADYSYTVTLPALVRDETIRTFDAQFATAPVWPTLIAFFFVYAEFILPICLVIGFGTRMAAFILLLMTVAMQIYIQPAALWATHVYLASILLVLTACGPGALSLDRLIRYIYHK
jgi:putative oxidoreductase